MVVHIYDVGALVRQILKLIETNLGAREMALLAGRVAGMGFYD